MGNRTGRWGFCVYIGYTWHIFHGTEHKFFIVQNVHSSFFHCRQKQESSHMLLLYRPWISAWIWTKPCFRYIYWFKHNGLLDVCLHFVKFMRIPFIFVVYLCQRRRRLGLWWSTNWGSPSSLPSFHHLHAATPGDGQSNMTPGYDVINLFCQPLPFKGFGGL